MCKVLIIPGIKEQHREKTIKFIKEMGKEMSYGNSDGLGYAAIDGEGRLFGERWLVNNDAFLNRELLEKPQSSRLKMFGKALDSKFETPTISFSANNKFGDGRLEDVAAITLHTRMATSPKCMENVHPFIYPEVDTSLIHNGVIYNHETFNKSVSTCDSEAILTAYIQEGVNLNTEAMTNAAKALAGYYACGVFSRDANKVRILDVFKGHHAQLYVQEIKELETYVFATNDNDVRAVCNRLNLTKGESIRVLEGNIMRINPFDGEIITQSDFIVGPSYVQHTSSYGGNILDWQRASSRNDGAGTIVDASNSGFRNRQRAVHGPKNSMTKEMLDYMQHKASMRELSQQEMLEELRAHKVWIASKQA